MKWPVAIGMAWLVGVLGCLEPWAGGIHAVLRYRGATQTVVVEEAPSGGASARAGLRVGDQVVSIDGVAVSGMTPEDVRRRVRGEVGTRVRIRVVRDGQERDVEIERAPYRRQ